MFEVFKRMQKNVLELNTNAIISEIIAQPLINSEIIDAQKAQWDIGLEADGSFMGNYSPISVSKYGKPDGPIKLEDTGATRESIKVLINDGSFTTAADMDLHGVDLAAIYPAALGLTSESLAELMPEIKSNVIEKVRAKILQ